MDYTIPFSLIASIEPRGRASVDARVTLHSGVQLQLERVGDLAESNAGMLVFANGTQHPDYVPWSEVERVDFSYIPKEFQPSASR